jgi:hypothetical protein
MRAPAPQTLHPRSRMQCMSALAEVYGLVSYAAHCTVMVSLIFG